MRPVVVALLLFQSLGFLRAQRVGCQNGQGAYNISAFYDGEPRNFNIAITNLGADPDAPERYILNLARNEVGMTVTRTGCFNSHSLHRFVVYDPAPRENTKYVLAVNGREISLRPRRQALEEYYFVGDSQFCVDGGRFQLEIVFDLWPEEIQWELTMRQLSGSADVVSSFRDTLKAGTSLYSLEFTLDTLVVDYCIGSGNFEFQLIDTVDFLFGDNAGWKVFFNNELIRQGKGSRGEGVMPFSYNTGMFDIDHVAIGPTPAPFTPSLPKVIGATDKPTPANVSPTSTGNMPIPMATGSPASTGNMPSPMATGTPVSFPKGPHSPICFAGSTNVLVQDVGPVEMRNLKIGDFIAVDGRGRYEPIYSFGHYEPQGVGSANDFLEIQTNRGDVLQVSRQHLVFIYLQRDMQRSLPITVPALAVKVGDELVSNQWNIPGGSTITNNAQVVTSIKPVHVNDGLYAPFTASGTFLVASKNNNAGHLLVSCYMSFGESYGMTIGSYFTLSYQWLAHSFEFPHRMACRYYFAMCEKETYNEHGLSRWVAKPFKFGSWIMQLDGFPKFLIMVLAGILFLIFSLLEHMYIMFPGGKTLLLIMAMRILWLRLRSSQHRNTKSSFSTFCYH